MAEERWHYFVGDIHGCYDEYLQLESQIHRHARYHKVEPFIVSVGDLVDRGPQSADVVRHFRLGFEAGTHAAVVGNHESFLISTLWDVGPWDEEEHGGFPVWMRSVVDRYDDGEGYARVLSVEDYQTFCRCMWLGQGGFECLESFGCDPFDPSAWTLEPEDLSFLIHLPLFWENDAFVVTHALVSQEELNCIRTFSPRAKNESEGAWQHRLFEYQSAAYQAVWRRDYPENPPDLQRTHVSGHTVFERVRRNSALKTVQIDTGCVYGMRLTAWCGEAHRYFRVRTSAF